MKRKTHEDYVKELKIKNPNVQVIEKYINANTKILHKCLKHDICWSTTPSRVLQGVGCEKCHAERIFQSKTRTHEEYVEQLKRVNPNIIPLEKFVTVNNPIIHRCTKHNIEWKVIPDNILRGHGCSECGKEKVGNKNKKPYEKYQEELKVKSPTIECIGSYKNSTTSVLHKCMICEYEWNSSPITILNGVGCPRCTNHLKRDEEYYIEELKQINPQLELVGTFTNMTTLTPHKCKIHDYIWDVLPTSIINGTGCPKCGREKLGLSLRKPHEEYVKELGEVTSNIVCLSEYTNSSTKIKVKCLKCNEIWEAYPYNLLSGHGCPACNISRGENIIKDWLKLHNIKYESQKRFNNCKDKRTLPFDFYIPSKNTAIEYDGKQHTEAIDWFGGKERLQYIKQHDQIKTQYCNENNIHLLRISYKDNIQEKLNSLFI